jgi:hypothetical protein
MGLGLGELDGVNVVGVSERLEELIGEAQGQDVLDRLPALQVVIDPKPGAGGNTDSTTSLSWAG